MPQPPKEVKWIYPDPVPADGRFVDVVRRADGTFDVWWGGPFDDRTYVVRLPARQAYLRLCALRLQGYVVPAAVFPYLRSRV